MVCFNSKAVIIVFMLIACMAYVAEGFVLGTLAGLALDAKLIALKVFALASFTRFLINSKLSFLFGRKKRDTPDFHEDMAAQAEKYLILAEALDSEDNCIQLSLCITMATAHNGNLTEVEKVFVQSFKPDNTTADLNQNVLGSVEPLEKKMFSISPPKSYMEAAAIGEESQSEVVCRRSYTACKLTDEEIRKATQDAENVF